MNNITKIRRFITTSGTYFFGSMLSKMISFFLLPLYTSKLLPEEFGMYDLIVTIISFFAPIAFFQIWDGMFRYSFDKKKITEKYKIITNSFFVFIFGILIYSFIFIIIFNMFNYDYFWLVFIYGLLVALQYQYTFIARAFLRNKLFVLSGLINSLISAIVNIVLILSYGMGIESLFIATILGSVFQVIFIEIRIKPIKHFRMDELDKQLQFDMIKFALPLCVASVSYWMLGGYTKVIISTKLGSYSNGIYAVATKFTSMISIVITVFQYAWNELAYLMVKDRNRILKYKVGIEYILKVIIMSSGIFMIVIKIVFPYIIDSTYKNALMIIPLSLIGVAANAFANFIGTIFMAEKQTRWILWSTFIAGLVNVLSLSIFTPLWGIQGAVGAFALSFFTIACLRLYAVGKLFNIKLSVSNLIYILLLGLVIYLFYIINNVSILMLIIIILVGILIYSFKDLLGLLMKKT